jgi:2-polyprenyl-6-hydroxyphenyl methylase/3-demethylubiquinone-9 3-methyltransferase
MQPAVMQPANDEIARGERFAFGENWSRFLRGLDEERIHAAEASLRGMLECERLDGRRFLDAGSGSGLFSLAARRLGARVHSFDFDPRSVACTEELRRRYFPGDGSWSVEQGSVLDEGYLARLGRFDVVYSWGVLHHTGEMWKALANVAPLVEPRGRLFISIYNDQGRASARWKWVKRTYNRGSPTVRALLIGAVMVRTWTLPLLKDLAAAQPLRTIRSTRTRARGMSYWSDVVDWIGGYPYEVARPDDIFEFYKRRGFALRQLKTWGAGAGCNEFVFVKEPTAQ